MILLELGFLHHRKFFFGIISIKIVLASCVPNLKVIGGCSKDSKLLDKYGKVAMTP